MWKVLSFIVIEDTRSTKESLTYLSKYTDHFSDVSICTVDLHLVIHKVFVSINEVNFHNKPRQSNLVMDKFRVTQCGWI